MKNFALSAKLLVAGSLAGMCGSLTAQSPKVAAQPSYARIAQNLGQFIRHEMEDKELPAFSIVLVDGQKIVWARGFGYADPEKKIPATVESDL